MKGEMQMKIFDIRDITSGYEKGSQIGEIVGQKLSSLQGLIQREARYVPGELISAIPVIGAPGKILADVILWRNPLYPKIQQTKDDVRSKIYSKSASIYGGMIGSRITADPATQVAQSLVRNVERQLTGFSKLVNQFKGKIKPNEKGRLD